MMNIMSHGFLRIPTQKTNGGTATAVSEVRYYPRWRFLRLVRLTSGTWAFYATSRTPSRPLRHPTLGRLAT